MYRRWSAVAVAGCLVVAALLFRSNSEPYELTVVEDWNLARASGDVDAAMMHLADDAVMFGLGMGNSYQRAEFIEILHAQTLAGLEVVDSDCEVEDVVVTCQYRQEDLFMRTVGVGLTGFHTYIVRDKIVHAHRLHDPESQKATYQAIDDFRAWVAIAHPELEDVIWSSRRAAFYVTRAGAQAAKDVLDEYISAGPPGT